MYESIRIAVKVANENSAESMQLKKHLLRRVGYFGTLLMILDQDMMD